MSYLFNEYLVATDSVPRHRPPAGQSMPRRRRRLRMARWAQRIQPQ
jgi:hypothetical protein